MNQADDAGLWAFGFVSVVLSIAVVLNAFLT